VTDSIDTLNSSPERRVSVRANLDYEIYKNMKLSNTLAIASLFLSVVSLVWIGGFRFSTLIHEVKDVKEDVQNVKEDIQNVKEDVQNLEDKMEKRLEKIEHQIEDLRLDLHKMDIRVTSVEQRKR